MKISRIISAIEEIAPLPLQEDYDNCGLIIGSPDEECSGVLLSVDVTPDTVREAIAEGCNLILSHHPLIFRGLRRLNGTTPAERAVIMAVRHNVAVYACHTCLDNAVGGVSHRMAHLLDLKDVEVLDPQTDRMIKLSVFVPQSHLDAVRTAIFDVGAGRIGRYDLCSYSVQGHGTFRPLPGSSPYVGEVGEMHTEEEVRLEVIMPSWLRNKAENAMLAAHPYEEPAYEFVAVINRSLRSGCGAVGMFYAPVTGRQLIDIVKDRFGSPVVRCNSYPVDERIITRVAVCGGSGAFLIGKAIGAGAQAIITSDVKYHDFVDHSSDILIIDIGHHESENCSKDIFYHGIKEKFPIFAVRYSQSDINPIKYL